MHDKFDTILGYDTERGEDAPSICHDGCVIHHGARMFFPFISGRRVTGGADRVARDNSARNKSNTSPFLSRERRGALRSLHPSRRARIERESDARRCMMIVRAGC